MTDAPPAPRGRPKGDKRARTRAALLAAARELVREVGHEGATVEAIAQRAGMSTGAIYGNFRSRDELLMALGQAYWPPVKPRIRPGAGFAEILRAFADAVIAAVPERREVAYGRLTGMAYALRREALQAEVARATADSFRGGAAWLRGAVAEDELPMPPEQLVVVIHALTEGLVFQRLLTPELVSDETIRAAFAALARSRESR
jgi:AcrR family transcriptional regulator